MTDVIPTRRLYYENQYLGRCVARVVEVNSYGVELDRTIAFPEGGGQEGDHGTLTAGDGAIRFCDARRLFGSPVALAGFPDITAGGCIYHTPVEDDRERARSLAPGDEVSVAIDVERRERLTISHTASHLLYMGIVRVRPDLLDGLKGCRITEQYGVFSFETERRLTPEEVRSIEEAANALVEAAVPITMSSPYPETPEARLWRCGDFVVPCGGTHLQNTAAVGRIAVQRKSSGRSQERVKCLFPEARIDLSRYEGGVA